MSKIRLAEIQLLANFQNDDIPAILEKIKRHTKMNKISYLFIFGVIAQYIGGRIYEKLELNTHLSMQIIDSIWIVFVNALILIIGLYYLSMAERFIKILSINYKLRKWLNRLLIYTTIFGIIYFNL